MYDNLKVWVLPILKKLIVTASGRKANNDILKIYFQKDKGEFFAKSVKFKYPRQRKTVVADGVGQGYKEVRKSARIYGISLMSLIKSASVTAAKLILSVRSSTTYVTGVSRNQ